MLCRLLRVGDVGADFEGVSELNSILYSVFFGDVRVISTSSLKSSIKISGVFLSSSLLLDTSDS